MINKIWINKKKREGIKKEAAFYSPGRNCSLLEKGNRLSLKAQSGFGSGEHQLLKVNYQPIPDFDDFASYPFYHKSLVLMNCRFVW
jgi:hypothetical protein